MSSSLSTDEKLNEARDTLATIIKMADDNPDLANSLVTTIRTEAVDCLDRIREED